MSEQSRKPSLQHNDGGDKGGCMLLCVYECVLAYVCHQGAGTGFSGRTSSFMLVFVRAPMARWDEGGVGSWGGWQGNA